MTKTVRWTRGSMWVAGLLCVLGRSVPLVADDFILKDGRRVSGTVVKKVEETFVVELSPGSMLLISPAEIKSHQQNNKGEAAYAEALKSLTDTIESHLQLAAVAQKYQLADHARAHSERVLELDPENQAARLNLGYVRNDKNGRWILRDEQMREYRGKVSIGGNRYRFPEIVARQEAEEKFDSERSKLAVELKRALGNLSNPRNAAKGQAILDGLQGPVASAAVTAMLYPRGTNNKNPTTAATKALMIPILERIGDDNAIRTLTAMCRELEGGSEQVALRKQALEALKKLSPQAAFHNFLSDLGSSKNAAINQAAELLQELGDERAVLPLIDRLITVERREFGGSQATSAGMSNGNMTFSKGDPKIVRNVNIENQGVLGALVSLTGENFQYDKGAWLNWYHQNYASFEGDLRRDP